MFGRSKNSQEEEIVCSDFGESYPKSKMRKCKTCGDVICPKCRKNHVCYSKENNMTVDESSHVETEKKSDIDIIDLYEEHSTISESQNDELEVISNSVVNEEDEDKEVFRGRGCGNSTEIEIPKSKTIIGINALSDHKELTRVIIPDSIKYIGNNAFSNCDKLTEIYIPDSVEELGDYVFVGCEILEEIHLSINLKKIGDGVFKNCNNLKEITIPDSVEELGNYVFVGCEKLEKIHLPNNLNEIGNGVFKNCNNLKGLTIPESVTSINTEAFLGCTSLVSITIPESVIHIGSYAFSECSSLTSIIIPKSVTSIEHRTFSKCSSLTSIIIPKSVTSIGNRAFSECSNLMSVNIPDSVTFIGDDAFKYCINLININCFKNHTDNKVIKQIISDTMELAIDGDSKAQFILGNHYENGELIEKNLGKAKYWFKKSAEQGYADAEFKMAEYSENIDDKLLLIRNASEKGHVKAKVELAILLLKNDDYINLNESVLLLTESSEQGDAFSQYYLGSIYYNPKYGMLDYNKAEYWFKKSAEQGNKDAQISLSNLYVNYDIEGDLQKTFDLCTKIAEEGNSEAEYILAMCYYKGKGTYKNPLKVKYWIEKAVEQDNEDALKFVEKHPELNLSGASNITYNGDIIQNNSGIIAKDDAIINRPSVTKEEEEDIPLFCSQCGKKVDSDSKFCKYCGAKIK